MIGLNCSGSRVDVVRTKIMAVAAHSQCSVCSFDFSGCGQSDGEYVRSNKYVLFLQAQLFILTSDRCFSIMNALD